MKLNKLLIKDNQLLLTVVLLVINIYAVFDAFQENNIIFVCLNSLVTGGLIGFLSFYSIFNNMRKLTSTQKEETKLNIFADKYLMDIIDDIKSDKITEKSEIICELTSLIIWKVDKLGELWGIEPPEPLKKVKEKTKEKPR